MKLYKYTTTKIGLSILKNQKIRFTQPAAFNDPFDSNPVVNFQFSKSQLEFLMTYLVKDDLIFNYILDELLKKEYPKLSSYEKKQKSKSQYKIEAENYIRKNISKILFDVSNFYINKISKYASESLLKRTRYNIGLLCLAKIPDNILMWSHYADSHKGVVLELDTNHTFFSNPNTKMPKLNAVHYSSLRPKIEIKSFENIEIDFAKKLFFTKSKVWEYEKEYRAIMLLNSDSLIINENPSTIYLIDIPIEIIKSVILGSRISKWYESKIKKLINNSGYKINIKKAIEDNSEFKINIEEIS